MVAGLTQSQAPPTAHLRRLSLTQRIDTIALSRGHHPALYDEAGTVTYQELVEGMRSTAAALREMGVASGDRIGIAMEPSAAYASLLLGCLYAGVIPAPVNTRLTPVEATRFLETVKPSLVVGDATYGDLALSTGLRAELLERALATIPLAQRLGPFGRATGATFEPPDEDAPAIIVATGGTSGVPKGVFYDHRGLVLFAVAASAYDGGNRFDVQLSISPFFHVALLTGVFSRLWAGGAVRTLKRFDPEQALIAIEQGCTRTAAATTLLTMMRDHPRFARTDRTGLRSLRVGGMAAGTDFIEQLMSWYPNAALHHGYAATEFGSVTAIEHEDFAAGRIAGVGRPHAGVEIRIVREDGAQADVGEVGEFVVRAPWQSSGYWGNPEETAMTYQADGIHLGDLGVVDEDGWLAFAGRRKEMIISGGENVFPTEVEAALSRHPGIADLIVYGVDDARWGERVEVGIVLHAGADVSLEQLRQFGRAELAGYKLPKTMRVIDAVPLTTVRKPDRRAARSDAEAAR